MRAVCVYCGSNDGTNPGYRAAARALGAEIANRGLRLVYGGARNGLMGAVADGALAAGGQVTGIIPHALVAWEQAHPDLSEQLVVDSMRARKQAMADRADGFIALPGGIGTLEEIFEMISWAQLGVHHKPCAFLDVEGYWDPLIRFLDYSVEVGLTRSGTRKMLLTDSDHKRLLTRMDNYRSPVTHRWLDAAQT
ncbi:TIGR00730 family Rossman fold protein [Motiliproteus sediminis]|uniref:LOG family protein n=1 Tax=Motiliproteus sediminis TaxID=1468178 RepID=UPI001AEF668E|nr:TIGR00730 family Rossman fold protein [Motiliproteus sediminis]